MLVGKLNIYSIQLQNNYQNKTNSPQLEITLAWWSTKRSKFIQVNQNHKPNHN